MVTQDKNNVGGIAVGTSSRRQKYLFAFASQMEVMHHVRTQALNADETQIVDAWQRAQTIAQALLQSEAGFADQHSVEPIAPQFEKKVGEYITNPLAQKSFPGPITVGFVEIDRLIAAQRTIDLDYVDDIMKSLPKNLDEAALIDFCLSPTRSMAPIQHLEIAPNVHVFSSPSTDLRYLGSFMKDLTEADKEYAQGGGIPATAIISFVGYGASAINAWFNNGRVVLNNGFHRVYALRSAGVKKIPVIVQLAANAQIEFPGQICGVPREYLLGHPRPPLVKDFFEDAFTTIVPVKARIRTVTIQAQAGQHDVPA